MIKSGGIKVFREGKRRGTGKISVKILFFIFAACVLLNVAARLSAAFSDFHRERVFPVLQGVFSRISGVFPFSVGEVMIILGILLVLGGLISYIALMVAKKRNRKRISIVYLKILAWILAFVLTTETLNYFMLYHCSTFAEAHGMTANEYTPEQLYAAALIIAEQTNAASQYVTRGENGLFALSNPANTHADARAAMRNLGETYPSLGGYYPNPKPLAFSGTVTRLNILGIYFPFSFEANYNRHIADIDKPSTICHELTHLKGWMLEDEANFISFLACVHSENPDFVYSGYASALNYIWNKVRSENGISDGDYLAFQNTIDAYVWNDLYHRRDIFRRAQEEKLGSVMTEVSNTAIEVNLKIQGVPDGAKSYGRFVDLILNYYLTEGLI